METFGLTVGQVNQLLVAIVTLLVLIDNVQSRLTHKNVKETKIQLDETQSVVQELTNGKLSSAVKQAVAEATEEKREI